MPNTLIYNTIDRAQITLTGNTIGLNGNLIVGQQGTQGAVGGLITLDTGSSFGNFPNGTTGDYLQDQSAAVLRLPDGAEILRAQLTWSAYFDVATRAIVRNPIQFTTPQGTVSIAPQISNYKVLNATSLAYSNTSDVTSILSTAGTYAAGAIPITLVNNDVNIYGGWTLQVIYRLPSLPYRAIALYYNQDLIGGAVTGKQVLTGFSTPVQGPVSGRLVASAGEGDAEIVGDQLQLGPSDIQLTPLSGPNNFANNFFASQIDGDNGQLDRSGTFGTRNNVNGSPGGNVAGARQGWDITNVDISGLLSNGLTQIVTQATSTGDFYLVPVLGLQIDANAADLTMTKSADPIDAFVGQTLTYTVTAANHTQVTATNVQLIDTLSIETVFVSGSLQVNGVTMASANPVNGISISDLHPGDVTTVSYQVTVISAPERSLIRNTAETTYSFQTLPGGPEISGFSEVSLDTAIYVPQFEISKSASVAAARVGDTVTYRIQIANVGNLATAGGKLTDPLDPSVMFIAGSVETNGAADPLAIPQTGIPLPAIPAGQSIIVSYQATVLTLPNPPQVVNQATASVPFVTPGGNRTTLLLTSNLAIVSIYTTGLQLTKAADRSTTRIGETITYTITATNSGTVINQNVTVSDLIPDGSSFIGGSVTLNGVNVTDGDPVIGIAAGSLQPMASTVVTFQVMVNALPPSGNLVNTADAQFNPVGGGQPLPADTVQSNTVSILVLANEAVFVKSADRSAVLTGEQITYTLVLRNAGTTTMQDITLLDILPLGTDLVLNSFRINGVVYPGFRPDIPQALPTLPALTSMYIQYSVVVSGVPIPAELRNQALLEYVFVAPDGSRVPSQSLSDTIVISVSPNALTISKSADHTDVIVGEIVLYSLRVSNQNAFELLNVTVFDLIPEGMILVAGSITIDGQSTTFDPVTGIRIGDLQPHTEVLVQFQLQSNALPSTGFYENIASAVFSVSPDGAEAGALSNRVSLPAIHSPAALTKAANVTSVLIGDSITYTFTFTNDSASALRTISIQDLIVPGLELVPGSVQVSIPAVIESAPALIIRVGELLPGQSFQFAFTVNAIGIPDDFTAYTNTAHADFYFVRAAGQSIPLNTVSNTVIVTLDELPPSDTPALTVVKSANTSTAIIGQTITYAISLTNTSALSIHAIVIRNLVNEGLRFLPGSITINGTLQSRLDSSSISVGSLLPNESVRVTVQAVILALPPSGEIVNRAMIDYNGISVPSNAVVIPVLQSRVIVEKFVSSSIAYIGQTLTFTIVVRNEGTDTAYNAALRDPINFGIRIDVATVRVNNVLVPINSMDIDGLPLGDIASGTTVVVTFTALVDCMPANAIVINQAFVDAEQIAPDSPLVPVRVPSNIVAVQILDNQVRIVKTTTATAASIGSTIDYTVEVVNGGSAAISNFTLRDILPPGTRYVPDSLSVAGSLRPDARLPFILDIPIGIIQPGGSIQISYQLVVVAVPIQGEIPNQMVSTYEKQLPTGELVSIIETSNTTITPFVDIRLTKRASQTTAATGEIITFVIEIHNNSHLTIFNNVVHDQLPDQVMMLGDTVTINDIPRAGTNIAKGVLLQPIQPGESVSITFDARIDSEQGVIENTAQLAYDVQLANGSLGKGRLNANVRVRVDADDEE